MSKLNWCLMFLGCSLYAAYIVGTVEYLDSAQSKMIHSQRAEPSPSPRVEKAEARPVPPQPEALVQPPTKRHDGDAGTPASSPDVAHPGQVIIPNPQQVHGQPAVFYADSVGYPDTYRLDITDGSTLTGRDDSLGTVADGPAGTAIDEVYAKAEPQDVSFSMQMYNGGPSMRMHPVQVPEPETVIMFTWGILLTLFAVRCRQS